MVWLVRICLLGAILEVRGFPSLGPTVVSEESENGESEFSVNSTAIAPAPSYGWDELQQCDPTSCQNATNGLPCGGPERGVCGCGSCMCKAGWMGRTCDCWQTAISCWLQTPPGPSGRTSGDTLAPAPYHLLIQLEKDLGLVSQGRVTGRGPALTSWDCDTVTGVPQSVRSDMELSYFYQKYLHAYGIPVLGSSRVPDSALRRACYVVRFMFADRQDVRDHFHDRYGRHALMAESEQTTDIPEHSWLGPSWNERARGLGATETHPVSTGAEENAGCYGPGRDRWHEEDIFLHETAHGLHGLGAKYAIPGWQARLQAAYDSARARGLWDNTYAGSTIQEYFAEGVQSFFNVESYRNPPDGIHNHVDTREKLYQYDPTLYGLISQVFPCSNHIVDRCSDQGLTSGTPLKMNCNSDGSGGISVEGNSGGESGNTYGGDGGSDAGNCQDLNSYCPDWAVQGYCSGVHSTYMSTNCRRSCDMCATGSGTGTGSSQENAGEGQGSYCEDTNGNCAGWAQRGECHYNPAYMNQHCPRSCNLCQRTTGST
ncbi:PREDICTED: uncharacterized protein LOC109476419 isoform X2 [Branchiostoma belcheri]|uniref:Uncharacterized protein LOC109476419 isoform X2 n=1 Tax=Branchiostoma belcheri TaxID=7741 RepID=A0A6P4YU15_BRABE|nr:PREDICTED: uncharacterized protein LOC109476419 isoform X2 [Branchiostoma belcheri]